MKKLALVGAEVHTRDNAPWDDESYDIWVVNEWAADDWVKRYSATVDIHWAQVYANEEFDRSGRYWQFLTEDRGKPVYMQDVDPDIPDSVKFPLREANALYANLTYKGRPVKNFRTSMSYCLALAILHGYEQIDTYGIELAGNEYRGQASNFAFWIGLAIGKGIKVNLNSSRGTFDAPLYGYEAFMHSTKAEKYIIGMTQQLDDTRKQMHMLEGAMMVCQQMIDEERQGEAVDAKEAQNA